jgi:hypothetical protein
MLHHAPWHLQHAAAAAPVLYKQWCNYPHLNQKVMHAHTCFLKVLFQTYQRLPLTPARIEGLTN